MPPHFAAFVATLAVPLALCCASAAASDLRAKPTNKSAASSSADPAKEVLRLRAEMEDLVGQLKRELASLPPAPDSSTSDGEHERRAQLTKLLGEIERRLRDDKRTTYVTSMPQEPAIRAYYQRLRWRVEQRANAEFRKERGKSVRGRVNLTFELSAQGRLERVEIVDSSSDALAQSAVQLLRELEPFEAFPQVIAKRIDRMVITTSFNYSDD